MKLSSIVPEKVLLIIIQILVGVIFFLPLYSNSSFYFPFITPRNFAFRILVEVAFFFYILLVSSNQKYLPRKHIIWLLLVLFFCALTISSFLSGDIFYSFWSNFERMEGLITHIHLLMFFFLLLGTFQTEAMWERMLNVSFLPAILVSLIGLSQMLHINFLLESSGGERISSTLGNPTYLAAYLLLYLFLGLYFIYKYKNTLWKVSLYGVSMIIFFIIILNTETRGALVGIFLGLLVGYILFFFYGKKSSLKSGLSIALVTVIIFFVWIFLNKTHPFVEGSDILRKISSISFEDETTQTRLATWKASMTAIQEKPMFGWGVENFYQAFDKYFPRVIYQQEDSVVWFDRPHNILIQYAIEGGIIGLSLYLAFLGSLIFYIVTKIHDKHIAIIFIMLLVTYVGQNFFVFDSINSFIPFYFILAFIMYSIQSSQPASETGNSQITQIFKKNSQAIVGFSAIAILAAIWYLNILPMQVNRAFAKDFIASADSVTPDHVKSVFKLIEQSPYVGKFEMIAANAERVTQYVQDKSFQQYVLSELVQKTEDQLKTAISLHPSDARLHIFLMNFYMNNVRLDPAFNEKLLEIRDKAVLLSPDRAYIYLIAGRAYMAKKDAEKGINEFKKAVEVAPWVYEPHLHLFAAYLDNKEYEKASEEYGEIKKIKVLNQEQFKQIAKVYLQFRLYDDAQKVLLEGIEKYPQSADLYAALADVYRVKGDSKSAKETALKAAEVDPSFAPEAEEFIKTLEK